MLTVDQWGGFREDHLRAQVNIHCHHQKKGRQSKPIFIKGRKSQIPLHFLVSFPGLNILLIRVPLLCNPNGVTTETPGTDSETAKMVTDHRGLAYIILSGYQMKNRSAGGV